MPKFKMTPHLADHMPRGFSFRTSLDALVDAEGLYECPTAIIEAPTVDEALSALFRECNIGERGYAKAYRDAKNRSLSVGDVVAVREADDAPAVDDTFYVVMPTGFETVDFDDVHELLTAHCTWYERIKQMREEEQAAAMA